MGLKYILFFAGLFLIVPAGAFVASYSRRIREIVFGLLVFSTAFTNWYDINFVQRWWYAGSTRGIEVSIVDLLTLILAFSTLSTMRREGARPYWPASLGLMLVYLAYGCFSVAISDPKLFGFFELTKLVRGLVVFLTVAWYVRTKRDAHILVFALGVALACNGGLAVWQRYTATLYRVQGTFVHPNILGDYCCLTAPILLAVALSQVRPVVRAFCAIAWTCAVVATVLTISRMPTAMFLAGSTGVLITALGFQVNLQRTVCVLALSIVALGLFYRGLDGLQQRQEADRAHAQTYELEEGTVAGRPGHYFVSWKMAKDHPYGVGLNNWGWFYFEYCTWLGDRGYSRPYASTADPGDGRAVPCHTLYGMTLGELGWPGLAIFAALVSQWLYLSASFLFVRNPDLWARIGVGCFFGFLAEFFANSTEITFRNQEIFIIFNVVLGFVVAARRVRAANTALPPGSQSPLLRRYCAPVT